MYKSHPPLCTGVSRRVSLNYHTPLERGRERASSPVNFMSIGLLGRPPRPFGGFERGRKFSKSEISSENVQVPPPLCTGVSRRVNLNYYTPLERGRERASSPANFMSIGLLGRPPRPFEGFERGRKNHLPGRGAEVRAPILDLLTLGESSRPPLSPGTGLASLRAGERPQNPEKALNLPLNPPIGKTFIAPNVPKTRLRVGPGPLSTAKRAWLREMRLGGGRGLQVWYQMYGKTCLRP